MSCNCVQPQIHVAAKESSLSRAKESVTAGRLSEAGELNFRSWREAVFPSALAKPQNQREIAHRSFAQKILRFFNVLNLERNP
jgi:hypothetical protein